MESWQREDLVVWGSQGRVQIVVGRPFQCAHQCEGSKDDSPFGEVQSGLMVLAQNTWGCEEGPTCAALDLTLGEGSGFV